MRSFSSNVGNSFSFFSFRPSKLRTWIHWVPNSMARARVRSSFNMLTARERQVLKLIAESRRNKDIAQYLCISVKTVEKHRANLMRKLNLHTASALTTFAIENGLVEL